MYNYVPHLDLLYGISTMYYGVGGVYWRGGVYYFNGPLGGAFIRGGAFIGGGRLLEDLRYVKVVKKI